jgi:Rps23 Pro-64 3,4-dihydroxylase Tpa1-like proline 4-hydroxylase
VGARASYFFRIGELLHHHANGGARPARNVIDSTTFGRAEYARADEPLVRPCRLNCYLRFLNPQMDQEHLKQCRKEIKDHGITVIRDILRPDLAQQIYKYLSQSMGDSWWVRAIKHQSTNDAIHLPLNAVGAIARETKIAREHMSQGLFSYSFQRTDGEHHKTCDCPACRIPDTVGSFEFLDFLSDLCGVRFTRPNEWFASRYTKGDWLTPHCDQGKAGKYGAALVFSFNPGYNPVHGGLLNFVKGIDEGRPEVFRTEVPSMNCLSVFMIDQNVGPWHFVSEIVGSQTVRLSVTGWLMTD